MNLERDKIYVTACGTKHVRILALDLRPGSPHPAIGVEVPKPDGRSQGYGAMFFSLTGECEHTTDWSLTREFRLPREFLAAVRKDSGDIGNVRGAKVADALHFLVANYPAEFWDVVLFREVLG